MDVASVIWSRRRFFPRFVVLQLAIRIGTTLGPGRHRTVIAGAMHKSSNVNGRTKRQVITPSHITRYEKEIAYCAYLYSQSKKKGSSQRAA